MLNMFAERTAIYLFCILSIFIVTGCDMTDEPERTYALDEAGIYSGSLSDNYALIGTLSGYAELWQLKPKSLLHRWQHTDASNGILGSEISADEKYAVTVERDSIAWWRIEDGVLLAVWSLPNIFSVSISPDGQYALVGLEDKAVYLALEYGAAKFAFPHDDKVVAVDISDSGNFAITGSEDYSAKLWQLSDGELQYTWQHDNKLSTVALSHNDKYALTNATLSQTRLWTLANGKVHKKIGPSRITLSSAAFSKNNKYLLLGHISQRIELWKPSAGTLEKFWRAKKSEAWRPSAATILDVHFVKKDKKFYSIATNGILQRWKRR